MNSDPRCGWRPAGGTSDLHVMSGCKGVLAATLLMALADVKDGGPHAGSASLDLDPGRIRRMLRQRAPIRNRPPLDDEELREDAEA